MLKKMRIRLPGQSALPAEVVAWIRECRAQGESFWDRAVELQDVERTECDFSLVAQAIYAIQPRSPRNRFLEWGCGLAVMTGAGGLFGMSSLGFEIVPDLCVEARIRLAKANIEAEVIEGNFLPTEAPALSTPEDPKVSLKHATPDAQPPSVADEALSAAGIVYVYSWPGEEHFLKLVFDRCAQPDTWLLLYRGPEHLEIYQKQ